MNTEVISAILRDRIAYRTYKNGEIYCFEKLKSSISTFHSFIFFDSPVSTNR